MSANGFNIPNIFGEGKSANINLKSKSNVKKKAKCKTKDCFERMEQDSIVQSKGMGIDQPRKDLGIETFSQDVRNAKNPLNAGLQIEAGFSMAKVQPQQQRNPLNVGLQVGNLGIDSFDTKKPAFSDRVLDQGIGATPVPRSALGGASNLGGDFITQVTGKKDGKKVKGTGFGGSGEDDFLRVSGRSFAGVPQIAGREPTVAGARASARGQQQSNDVRDLDIAGGLDSLAGGLGRSANAVLLREKGQKKFRKQTLKAFEESKGIRIIKSKIPTEDPILSGIGKIRKQRQAKQFAERGLNEDEAREEQELREAIQKRANEQGRARMSAEEDRLRRELAKRKALTQTAGTLGNQQSRVALTEIDMSKRVTVGRTQPQNQFNQPLNPKPQPNINTFEVEKQKLNRKPFSSDFDKDGDGKIDTIGTIGDSLPKGLFGNKRIQPNIPQRKDLRFGEQVDVTNKPDAGAFGSKKEKQKSKKKIKKGAK